MNMSYIDYREKLREIHQAECSKNEGTISKYFSFYDWNLLQEKKYRNSNGLAPTQLITDKAVYEFLKDANNDIRN